MIRLLLIAVILGASIPRITAAHYRVFVVTGQSNSLGTTNGTETDLSPGNDAADSRVRFFWHNVADATTSIGNSGGSFTTLQAQQGGYYAGSATHWGPEIGFARTLARAGLDHIAIIKASRGGGGNTHWSKAAGGHMYSHVLTTVQAAASAFSAAGDTFEIAGLLYLQGESDSSTEANLAATRITELVDNLRADLPNAANMRAVIGGIAAAGSTRDIVRTQQSSAASASTLIDDFSNLDLQSQVTDGLHFNRAAKLRIGSRFALAFLGNGTLSRRYGRFTFIGDSITQGGNGDRPSYRYQIFKRLASAGVPIDPVNGYKFTGSVTGPQTTPVLTTPDVNGQVFENIHDGHYGWRASWINGRIRLPSDRRSNNRGEGTLLNWTAQASPQTYHISNPDSTVPYPDPAATTTGNTGTTYQPDTAVLMIGINDLADDNNGASQLIADTGTLIDQLRAANPAVRLFINPLLYTNQTTAMRNAVDAFNSQLPALVLAKNNASPTSPVWLTDANIGFNPVTMTYDNIHPNATGETYVGDRIAAALSIIEEPAAAAVSPPPSTEADSSSFSTRFEGNAIWNGTAFVNNWAEAGGVLTKSLPTATDLRLVHPTTTGRWIEGTSTGWSAIASGSWTFETRIQCTANANGFAIWLGTGSRRIIVEIHGNRIQDHADGGQAFNVPSNNLDGNFHILRIVHDAPNARYHVFRDGVRLSPLDGATYDQTAADSRLILGDYTSGTFGNQFDVTLDHVRYTNSALIPPGTDADADGMPDAWEYQYFGTLNGASAAGNPDEDAFTNLQEYQNGTNPIVADASTSTNPLPVHLLIGAGNALGTLAGTTVPGPAPGTHPAEMSGGVWFHDGTTWQILAARPDGSYGPELTFARLLWDTGHRNFGILKSTTTGGGNSLWIKPSGSAWQSILTAANAASTTVPSGFDSLDFRSLLYLQGESNDATEADQADLRFSTLLDNLRSDLPGAQNLKAVVGEIGGTGSIRDTTRARLSSLATARADIGYAAATGITVHNLDGLSIHFNASGTQLMGSRLAAEAIAMNLTGMQPLPARQNLHAWYIADHAAAPDGSGAVTRWGSLHEGAATRDLARKVSGQTFHKEVTVAGNPRRILAFDGTCDLWANQTTEFGTLSGARSIAILCRLTGNGDGYLFDGSTNAGRTRAQVRAGSWQAGVTPTGAGVAWNLADPPTTTASTGWQRHVFTYTPNPTNTATTVSHWINGSLVATITDNESAPLGGLIVGSNGGSPFSRISADVAEMAVYSKALDATEVAALDSAWTASWGAPSGPPFSARVLQSPRDVPRFGNHPVLEIPITAEASGTTTLDSLSLTLRQSAPDAVQSWRIHAGATFQASSPPLAEIPGGASTWNPVLNLALQEGINRIYLTAIPARHATLGSTIDAAVISMQFSGATQGPVIPETPDPAGSLTLALTPLFSDVRTSGEGGVTTYRIPGLVCDTDGILHAVYDHRYTGGADLPANVDVGYARSTDGGTSWSSSQVILDFDSSVPGSSGNGVGDPCILHDPVTDTLWVAALWSFGDNAYNGSGAGTAPADTGQYVLTKSTDGGLTWSPPINITTDVKDDVNWRLVFQGPGHGLAMRDGTLVFPSQYRDSTGTVRVCSVFSTDHGATWDFGSGVPTSSPQTNENTVCELDDGRLLFSMRTPSGSNGQRAWIHYTPEGPSPMRSGTWGSLYRLASVPDPVCQGSVIQYTSTHRGDPREWILFGNPGSSSSRINFTLRLSPDGGATWPVSRLLYGGPSAYSSICVLPDRSIGVLFEKDNYTKITFARVEEAWLLNPDVDSDADGIPDAWESLHGVNPTSSDAGGDPDGDGDTNRSEYLAGTDPFNPGSRFRANTTVSPSAVDLTWSGVPGRSYRIEESMDLVSWGPAPGIGTITATSSSCAATLPRDSSTQRFFRIRALP